GITDRELGKVNTHGLRHAAPLLGHEAGAVADATSDVEEPSRPELGGGELVPPEVELECSLAGHVLGGDLVGDNPLDRARFAAHESMALCAESSPPAVWTLNHRDARASR